jgi:hypothetical protein
MILGAKRGGRPAPAGAYAPGRACAPEIPPAARVSETDLALPGIRFAAPTFKRFYEPDSLRVMTDALDHACRMLPPTVRESESLRRRLAVHIMHGVDAGERDPVRLATTAVLSARI